MTRNLLLCLVGCCILSCAVVRKYPLVHTQFDRVLILGNSITRHGPAPALGWNGDWGMAASSQDKDYVHILERKFNQVNTSVEFRVKTIVDFERRYWNYDLDSLKRVENWKPDLVILRIGENVDAKTCVKYDFQSHYKALLNYFISNNPDVKIICASSFWEKPVVDKSIEDASRQSNCTYLKISQLALDSQNTALGEFSNKGVAAHPSDLGMAAIANLIWEKVLTTNGTEN